MKRIAVLLYLLCSVVTLSNAQDQLDGTWLFKSPDGQLSSRLVISEGKLTYERLISYNVDEPYWEEDKVLVIAEKKQIDNGYQIVGQEDGQYYAGELVSDPSKSTLYVYEMREGSSSASDAFANLNDKPLRREMSKVAYKEERLKEIEGSPSLDDLKKEQLIVMMNAVYEYEKEMTAFNENDRMIGRIGRNIMNQEFIKLGFDPDKPTDGYYMKRFADDPDIKVLLDRQVYFKMY